MTSKPAGHLEAEAWLLGQPPLHKLLSYVEETVVEGDRPPQSQRVDEWRTANDLYYELEKSEGGIADQIGINDLPSAMTPLADLLRADPHYMRVYNVVPTRIAMVELDKLVVSQQHVNITHAASAMKKLGRSPSDADIFHLSLPVKRADPPIHVREMGPKRYVIWSPSSDIRFHEERIFNPGDMTNYTTNGPVGAVLGLVVGFGSNFLNAVESDSRLVLHNGHHRAYALRAMGLTHAPCIIQTVTRTDELNIVASRNVCDSPAFYFKAARPPLLKDFFDRRLHKVLHVPKLVRMIEINFEVRDFEVKDFASGL